MAADPERLSCRTLRGSVWSGWEFSGDTSSVRLLGLSGGERGVVFVWKDLAFRVDSVRFDRVGGLTNGSV